MRQTGEKQGVPPGFPWVRRDVGTGPSGRKTHFFGLETTIFALQFHFQNI
jgi:hypothetical protein